MLIKTEIRKKLSKNNHLRPHKVAICICDVCSKEFIYQINVKVHILASHHFCTKSCVIISQKSGGIICEKLRLTLIDKYRMAPWHLPSARIKQRSSIIQKYGIYPFATVEANTKANSITGRIKAHNTMKRNGTYSKSKPEDMLYSVLCEMFGNENIVRQHVVYKWPIDFYVKTIDTYIQYDSYWHGFKKGVLRDINEVAEYKNKRDVVIHKKMLTDIAQNNYFVERGFKLVRIHDLCDKQLMRDTLTQLFIA